MELHSTHISHVNTMSPLKANFLSKYGKMTGLSLLVIGFLGLTLTMFTLRTIMFILMFATGVALLISYQFQQMIRKGLIFYCPPGVQTLLLDRSIFDILCDIWFIPNITLYVKALAAPFISRMDPEEAVHLLTDLSPKFNRAILTKGLLNLAPHTVQTSFIPAYDDTIILEQTDPRSALQHSTEKFEAFKKNFHHHELEVPSPNLPKKTPSFGDLSIEALSKNAEKRSDMRRAVSTAAVTAIEDIDREELSKKMSVESSESSQEGASSPEMKKRLNKDQPSDHRELIQTWNWDNRAAFEAFKLKMAEKKSRTTDTGNKLLNHIISRVTDRLQPLAERLDVGKLKKMMLVSLGLLGAQLYASRKARKWSKTFLQFLIYSTSFLIFVGLFAVMQLKKMHQKRLDDPKSEKAPKK